MAVQWVKRADIVSVLVDLEGLPLENKDLFVALVLFSLWIERRRTSKMFQNTSLSLGFRGKDWHSFWWIVREYMFVFYFHLKVFWSENVYWFEKIVTDILFLKLYLTVFGIPGEQNLGPDLWICHPLYVLVSGFFLWEPGTTCADQVWSFRWNKKESRRWWEGFCKVKEKGEVISLWKTAGIHESCNLFGNLK